jgi:hypothetical protein
MNEGWPTTRTYPRTLLEAFPDDIQNAQWWYPPEQRWQDKVFFYLMITLWVCIAFYLAKD